MNYLSLASIFTTGLEFWFNQVPIAVADIESGLATDWIDWLIPNLKIPPNALTSPATSGITESNLTGY